MLEISTLIAPQKKPASAPRYKAVITQIAVIGLNSGMNRPNTASAVMIAVITIRREPIFFRSKPVMNNKSVSAAIPSDTIRYRCPSNTSAETAVSAGISAKGIA